MNEMSGRGAGRPPRTGRSQRLAVALADLAVALAVPSGVVLATAAPAAAVGMTATTTLVTDNASGVVTGGSFTFTATVTATTPPSTPVPTGTITWTVTGSSSNSCTTSTLNGTGQATCTVSSGRARDLLRNGGLRWRHHLRRQLLGPATTATVGKATPTTPTISNLPWSGTPGGGFIADVNTDGDGANS